MYTPDHFKEERPEILSAAIAHIGLATLVIHGTAGLEASQIPMVLDAQDVPPFGVLNGHVARANPLWRHAKGEALAVFLGPHAYVSPSWYPSKVETGKVVPTWNYLAVHAHGKIEFFADPVRLRRHLEQLTKANEAGRIAPWMLSDAPESYIAQMMRGIVGFRLTITKLEGARKMSQNKSASEREGVMEGLARDGATDTLSVMKA
jgi:transcriptional regulator